MSARKRRMERFPIVEPDLVELEAQRIWGSRERQFLRAYPDYRHIEWREASEQARKLMLDAALHELRGRGVQV